MHEGMLVGPGVVVTALGPDAQVREDAGVALHGGRVCEIGPWNRLVERYPVARRVDAGGGFILPGLVNLHHHLYSTLARGLDPGVPMHGFADVLEGLWWRLDRALDRESVRLSAALGLADCIRWGCTTLFDHHASPAFLEGSLELIAREVERAGLRGALCYEVSDRTSHDEAMRGLDENLEFAAARADDARVRALLGLHASFTVEDETLKAAARKRPADLGVHVHLCEDVVDAEVSMERFGARPVERLHRFGLLDRNALLVHGVHLDERELAVVAESGATLVHNPESNSNNGVGRLDLQACDRTGVRLALGTDGMSGNMLRSLRAAFLGLRSGMRDPSLGFSIIPELLSANTRRAAELFAEPLLGSLQIGSPGDVVVVDQAPATPVDDGNWFGHLVYGASESPVRHTIAGGRVVLEDFRHVGLDVEGLSREAQTIAPALWERFRTLPPNAPR